MYDVVTLGETMLRLTPPNLERLERSDTLIIEVGGSESNVSVGLSRLGLKVAWLSRLANNAFGHKITSVLSGHGIDTKHVCWSDDDRLGIYFLEEGRPPRQSSVIYDRKDSAMSKMQSTDLPEAIFSQTKLFHTSGITLAISETARATAERAFSLAKQVGTKLSFDVNYRAKLASPEAAKSQCHPFMAEADVIFIALRDARTLFALKGEPEAILQTLHQSYPQATITLTMSSEGSLGINTQGESFKQGIFQAEAVGRIGGGDAYAAGFLYSYLRESGGLERQLRFAAAAAAHKYSTLGDMPLYNLEEVQRVINSQGSEVAR
jgi:2-dehydro-3-deoxygluconokinase